MPERIDVARAREHLQPLDVRLLLRVPPRVMSNYELHGALLRDDDVDTTKNPDAYDRRGLLNVIAYLVERARQDAG